VQPRATRVAFAASPVADGAADVPLRVTVRVLKVSVPAVPSKAASLTKMSSTEACVSAQEVKTTFPRFVEPKRFNDAPSVKVLNAGVPKINEMTLPPAVKSPICSIFGKEIVVSDAKVSGLSTCRKLVNSGKLKVVSNGFVSISTEPVMVCNAGTLTVDRVRQPNGPN